MASESVLVDTSVWIEHFRRNVPALERLLIADRVACHPAVIGELACGLLRQRATTLDLLARLRNVARPTDEEALRFLDDHGLFGCGLGWTDVHLLAASLLDGCSLWTLDRRLREAGKRLSVAFDP